MLSTEGASDAPSTRSDDPRVQDTDTLHVRMARWPGPKSDFVELEAFDGRSLGDEYAAWHEHDGAACLAVFTSGRTGVVAQGPTRREECAYSAATLLEPEEKEAKLPRYAQHLLSKLRGIVREHLAEHDGGPAGANVWAEDHAQGHWPISRNGGVQLRMPDGAVVTVRFNRDGDGVELATNGGRMAIRPVVTNVIEVLPEASR